MRPTKAATSTAALALALAAFTAAPGCAPVLAGTGVATIAVGGATIHSASCGRIEVLFSMGLSCALPRAFGGLTVATGIVLVIASLVVLL